MVILNLYLIQILIARKLRVGANMHAYDIFFSNIILYLFDNAYDML
jgi:hypothetical protein